MVALLSWTASAICFFLTLYLIRSRGFMEGRRVWVVALLLVPVWFTTTFAALTVDARTTCAAAILLGFLLQPVNGRCSPRWYFSDFAMLLLCLGIILTQFIKESSDPITPLDTIRGLALPYVVGRLFLRSSRDIDTILPAFCVAIALLAGFALVEGISRKNPLELFLGRPWSKVANEVFDEVRWGLRRAYGPQTHAIYLGLTFAMVMPWAIEAAVRSWKKLGPWWWRVVPFLDVAGIVCTGSRAAQIAVVVVLFATFFQSFRSWRWTLVFLGIAGGIAFMAARDDVIDLMGKYISEGSEGESYVKVNGELRKYSGTIHRDLLNEVYEEAIEHNDWIGYGSRMKGMSRDPDMDERFDSIDNHYLMWFLQYGYLGMVLFGLAAISFLGNLLLPLLYGTGAPGRLAGGVFGAMIGALIGMRGVWFASDYASVWLFCGGLSVSLARLREGDSAAEGATTSV